MKKVVALGLDGLEPSIIESMMSRGELPNFATLQSLGSYRRLQTTYPAQTPVAWSTFVTGTNPGGHGIFDFICRNPQTYQPDLALSRFEPPRNRFSPPRAVSRRRGFPVWQALHEAGVPATILRCPCTFSPDESGAVILAGLGVPDIRGGQGTGTFYTQDKTVSARESEQVVHLEAGDKLKSCLIGPRDTRQTPARDLTAELKVRVAPSGRGLLFEVGGTPSVIEVAEKTWSQWVQVKFKISMFQSVSAIARLFVCRLSPHIEFYVSPLNFDPATPVFPISAPAGYAKELADRIGLFATIGMAEDHHGHNNGRLDDAAYLAQCELVSAERERMFLFELDRLTEGFLFVLFDTPDRVQHMFWRFRDREHPCFDPKLAETEHPIEDMYRACDKLLGRVMQRVDEDTLLIVLSDHGFGNFRRAFDINTWLWQEGLLKFRDNQRPYNETGNGFAAVDWSKTYAYAIGLGSIYLNLRGRETDGIVGERSACGKPSKPDFPK
jgi:predicted AlkP superfamily phosphohydrolase/phosphomutase